MALHFYLEFFRNTLQEWSYGKCVDVESMLALELVDNLPACVGDCWLEYSEGRKNARSQYLETKRGILFRVHRLWS